VDSLIQIDAAENTIGGQDLRRRAVYQRLPTGVDDFTDY
jgi:hypothetical protein